MEIKINCIHKPFTIGITIGFNEISTTCSMAESFRQRNSVVTIKRAKTASAIALSAGGKFNVGRFREANRIRWLLAYQCLRSYFWSGKGTRIVATVSRFWAPVESARTRNHTANPLFNRARTIWSVARYNSQAETNRINTMLTFWSSTEKLERFGYLNNGKWPH